MGRIHGDGRRPGRRGFGGRGASRQYRIHMVYYTVVHLKLTNGILIHLIINNRNNLTRGKKKGQPNIFMAHLDEKPYLV